MLKVSNGINSLSIRKSCIEKKKPLKSDKLNNLQSYWSYRWCPLSWNWTLRAWKKYKEKKEHRCKHAIHHREKTCGLKYNLPIVCSHLHTTHCMQWNICPQISRCSRSLWPCWNIKYYTCLRATFKLHPSGVCMRVIVQPAQRHSEECWGSLRQSDLQSVSI